MAPLLGVQQPVSMERQQFKPLLSGYVANGPIRRSSLGHIHCGHKECPQWRQLSQRDKKQWELSSYQSQYILTDRSPNSDWVPPSQRARIIPPAPPEVPEARVLKQSHLHGNVGIITNPQPSTTDTTNFLIRVPYNKKDVDKSARPTQPKDRKLFEQSSEILSSPRMLSASTLNPRQELFDVNYACFPYGDTCLDDHVPKRLSVRPVDDPPQPPQTPSSPRRSPRMKFEPPTRPGASFRRRTEKNYSDILESSPPVAYGLNRLPRADMNTLALQGFDFQDTRTEHARRNGEFRIPERMRSAPELPGVDCIRSPRSPRRSYRDSPPAGIGGCGGGGETELMIGIDEEEALTERASAEASKIWQAVRRHSINIEEISSPLNRARRQAIKERSKDFGEAKPIDWEAVHSPRPHFPGMDAPVPPRLPQSPGCGSPRSPRCKPRQVGNPRENPFSPRGRALMSEDEIDALPCKAASRGHYQRAMSSDPANLFGGFSVPCP